MLQGIIVFIKNNELLFFKYKLAIISIFIIFDIYFFEKISLNNSFK